MKSGFASMTNLDLIGLQGLTEQEARLVVLFAARVSHTPAIWH